MFYLVMIFAMIVWGSSWISAKSISGFTHPQVIAFWRLFLTFVSFIPIYFIKEKKFSLCRKQVLLLLFAGVLLALYNKLFFLGLQNGLPGKGGISVTTLNPLCTFLITITLLHHATSKLQIFGLGLGLCGGLILIEIWKINYPDLLASGNLFFIISAVVWAVLTIVTQYTLKTMSYLKYSFFVYGISAAVSYLFAINHSPFAISQFPAVYWPHILYLSVVVISFATTIYFFAADKIGSNKASSFTFLVPFTAVSLSWIVFGEEPTIPTICGGILALAAIYLINRAKVSGHS